VARRKPVLLVACGALAREIGAVTRASGRTGDIGAFDLTCLPAHLHNTPEKIPEAVRARIRAKRDGYERVYVVYGDCGTGGMLDKVLAEEGVERIDGPHCYAFFAGQARFDALMDEELGSYFLTDFLVRHFERLVIAGLGLDRRPDLLPLYFGNYRRVVYLSQAPDDDLMARARAAAERLGLDFVHVPSGYGELASFLHAARPLDAAA
jgi:hypothetical protein